MDKIYRQHSESPRMQELRFKHMDHMTGEDLYGKAEIAEELAVRDKRIEELEKALRQARAIIIYWAVNPVYNGDEMDRDLVAIDKALAGDTNDQ